MEPRYTRQAHDDRRGDLHMDTGAATRASKSKPDVPTLQFVNITGSVTLDEASRTEIRAQVMRDWHRRKKQQSFCSDSAARGADTSSGSAAAATTRIHRFTLGTRSLLPRIPISSRTRSGPKDTHFRELEQEHELAFRPHENAFVAAPSTPQDGQVMQKVASEGKPLPSAGTLRPNQPKKAERQCLRNLEYFLQTETLHNVPSPGALDPFNAMSLLITPRTQQLLHYYFNDRLQSAWLLIPVRKAYFSIAVHDQAFLHTCLAYYAGRWYSLRFQRGDSIESLQHRMQAVRILNERMEDPLQSLTDGTIGAVANLAAYEAANGCTHAMDVHIKGLHKMITMRGGLDKLHPYIQRLIAWADLNTANALSASPSLPIIGHWATETPKQAWTISQEPSATPTITFDQLATTSTLEALFATLRSLTITLQRAYSYETTQQHDINTSDQLYYSQARLYALYCHSYGGKRPLITATTAAMLIYSYRCLRDTSFTFRIIGKLVRNLKAELLQMPEGELLACEHAERFLWVLALGGMAAEGKCERPWYVARFRMMAGELGLWSWRQVKRVLEGILWMKELDEPGWKLWVETGGDVILDRDLGELLHF